MGKILAKWCKTFNQILIINTEITFWSLKLVLRWGTFRTFAANFVCHWEHFHYSWKRQNIEEISGRTGTRSPYLSRFPELASFCVQFIVLYAGLVFQTGCVCGLERERRTAPAQNGCRHEMHKTTTTTMSAKIKSCASERAKEKKTSIVAIATICKLRHFLNNIVFIIMNLCPQNNN